MRQVECGVPGSPSVLATTGPTVLVRIGFDQQYKPGATINLPSQQYHALIDTGATSSCIDSSIAINLSLPVIDQRPIAGVLGPGTANVHLAQMDMIGLDHLEYGSFLGVHLHAGGQPHSALIGRDLLQHFDMQYFGATGSVVLSVPQ